MFVIIYTFSNASVKCEMLVFLIPQRPNQNLVGWGVVKKERVRGVRVGNKLIPLRIKSNEQDVEQEPTQFLFASLP